ncbi:MAG: S-layer homology domain-containing protein [Oscillospiraceae bacterium]|nr:S-layer homology domain-containing protein [Oscillospiraceae bacterium]
MRRKTSLKGLLALALCAVLSLSLLSGAAFAVETFSASEDCVALIKEFEGFRSLPYTDSSGEWYIGYGTECEPEDYPAGITEWEADELLRRHLAERDEPMVNGFLLQYGISVSQQQFDALASLTYNLGSQWINPEYRLCAYLINGIGRYTEAEVVNAIAAWCHSGTTVLENLVDRRLREAFLLLYGDYEFRDTASRYCYIDFEPNGGQKPADQGSRTVFYPTGSVYGPLPVPTLAGQEFLGWFTTDGVQLTGQETAVSSLHVYARWSSGGTVIPDPTPSQPKIDYTTWVNPYRDVKESDWHYTYVRELSYHSIVKGYDENGALYFRPDGTLTAGEALKLLLVTALQIDPGNAASGHWAANYLTMAENMGCVVPGEILDLDAPIGRLAIAKIAAIAMQLELKTGISPFADIDDTYALTLYEAGIITGEIQGGQRLYNPYSNVTRAEMSAIVSRLRSYSTPNDPAKSGYISYRDKLIPVDWSVPAAPYNKSLFVRDGSRLYYNDPAYTTEWGIDVARYQGDIDWQKVAGAGVQFALIRVGGRFAESGDIYDDVKFEEYLTGAKAAGLKTGIYFYSQAVNVTEAIEEALYAIGKLNGRPLEYPIIFDWEIYSKTARSYGVDKTTLTDCAIAFCDTVAQAGYTPMIYMGLEVGYERLELNRLTGYDFWFAQYNSRNQPDMYYNYRIWQYTDSGSVPGIEGKVDMDLAFIPYG